MPGTTYSDSVGSDSYLSNGYASESHKTSDVSDAGSETHAEHPDHADHPDDADHHSSLGNATSDAHWVPITVDELVSSRIDRAKPPVTRARTPRIVQGLGSDSPTTGNVGAALLSDDGVFSDHRSDANTTSQESVASLVPNDVSADNCSDYGGDVELHEEDEAKRNEACLRDLQDDEGSSNGSDDKRESFPTSARKEKVLYNFGVENFSLSQQKAMHAMAVDVFPCNHGWLASPEELMNLTKCGTYEEMDDCMRMCPSCGSSMSPSAAAGRVSKSLIGNSKVRLLHLACDDANCATHVKYKPGAPWTWHSARMTKTVVKKDARERVLSKEIVKKKRMTGPCECVTQRKEFITLMMQNDMSLLKTYKRRMSRLVEIIAQVAAKHDALGEQPAQQELLGEKPAADELLDEKPAEILLGNGDTSVAVTKNNNEPSTRWRALRRVKASSCSSRWLMWQRCMPLASPQEDVIWTKDFLLDSARINAIVEGDKRQQMWLAYTRRSM
eukprot:2802654-Pleurochrysis_carterae.AAC.1